MTDIVNGAPIIYRCIAILCPVSKRCTVKFARWSYKNSVVPLHLNIGAAETDFLPFLARSSAEHLKKSQKLYLLGIEDSYLAGVYSCLQFPYAGYTVCSRYSNTSSTLANRANV